MTAMGREQSKRDAVRRSDCNTLSHSGLTNVIRKRMFYPLIARGYFQRQIFAKCFQTFLFSDWDLTVKISIPCTMEGCWFLDGDKFKMTLYVTVFQKLL